MSDAFRARGDASHAGTARRALRDHRRHRRALRGSPLPTLDVDICPAPDDANLSALARALTALDATIRAADAPDGLPFAREAAFLRQMKLLYLRTPFGDLDLVFEPAGSSGFDALSIGAIRYDLGDGLIVPVAALEDIVRSKEAADRVKDRIALPVLRLRSPGSDFLL